MRMKALHSIFEDARDLIVAADRDRRIVLCNGAFRTWFRSRYGLPVQAGDNIDKLLAGSVLEGTKLTRLWDHALAGQTFETELEFHGPTEACRHFIRFFPIQDDDGTIIGAAQVSHDVTIPKQLERQIRRVNQELVRQVAEKTSALRINEERFRAIFEYAPVGIAHIALDGRWQLVNRRMSEITGYSPEELADTTFQSISHPDDLAEHRAKIQQLKNGEITAYQMEVRCFRKDGTMIWVLLTGGMLHETPPCFIAVVEDITHRKAAEKILHTAKAEAERANRSKSRFLAAASHDLRQPAQSIALFSSVLEMRLQGTAEAQVVERLQQSVEGLRTLLDALADVSKLDAGLVEPAFEDVPLSPLLDRLVRDYGGHANSQGLSLRKVDCNATVRSDPILLERILRNLLDNAIRYTPAGDILIGCRRRGDQISIEVVDTGIGIPPEHVESVFEDFHQVGNSARDRSLGLGLGLAIVRRLAALLGHDIHLHSTVGAGSRFSLQLEAVPPKAVEEEAAQFMAPAAPQESQMTDRTAFVIDDEELVRMGLVLMLDGWGYHVVSCSNGAEAEKALDRQSPDIIIADYRLAEGEIGTTVVSRLRAKARSCIPALVLTGDTAPERIAEAASSGLSILHKPVNTKTLQHALARLLN